MYNYILKKQNLSLAQIAQSAFLSEYGLHHAKLSRTDEKYWLGHLIIASIEFIPIIGQIVTIAEIAFNILHNSYKFFQKIHFKVNSIVFEGSQEDCNGVFEAEKVQNIVKTLNNLSPTGIKFGEHVKSNFLLGGTCSAMAFDFLATYRETKHLKENEGLDFIALIKNLDKKYVRSGNEFRNTQAALNTIQIPEEIRQNNPTDHANNKIQAMLAFYGFGIIATTHEFNLNENVDIEFKQTIELLPKGKYVIRLIEKNNNVKLETRGHTFIYLKKNLGILYDANLGAKNLESNLHADKILHWLQINKQEYHISHARFYRLTCKKNSYQFTSA
jgi:hypothetical protein